MTIFEMWNRPASDFQIGARFIHPTDQADVDELFDYHSKYLDTFPAPFWGPLRSAKLVLCYAGPGNTENNRDDDRTQAADPEWRARRCASFNGETPFDANQHHQRALNWFRGRIRSVLGERDPLTLDHLADQIAFAELTAYRGKHTNWREVAFLPTTQAMRDWARKVLFPEARQERRVVLIMRAHQWWGVSRTPAWARGYLFAPETNRGGYLLNGRPVGQQARAAARAILGLPPL